MKNIKITFLGTSAMVPTVDRNLSSILFNYSPDVFLFDCGEGTQRQLRNIKFSPNKINSIFISHTHGDHVTGIPGLLWTMNSNDRKKKLNIYGPIGIKKFFSNLNITFNLNLNYEIEVFELKNEGVFFENKDLVISAYYLLHSVKTIGFSIQEKDKIKLSDEKIRTIGIENNPLLKKLKLMEVVEFNNKEIKPEDIGTLEKGRKVSIIMDTQECSNYSKIAKDSDLLITESTHISRDKDMAEKSMHMTAKRCAEIAKDCNVNKLVLTHISQRYKNDDIVLKDAKKHFKNVFVATDFFEVNL